MITYHVRTLKRELTGPQLEAVPRGTIRFFQLLLLIISKKKCHFSSLFFVILSFCLQCLFPQVSASSLSRTGVFKTPLPLFALTPRSYSVNKMVCFSFFPCQTRHSDIDVNPSVRSSRPNERSENRLYIPFQSQPKSPTCNTVRNIINLDEKTRGNLSSKLTEKCHLFHLDPARG